MAQKNMCHHWEVLDDPRQGDTVCLECGLVLEPCIGGREGPGVYRHRFVDFDTALRWDDEVVKPPSVAEERVRDVLQVLHMDNNEQLVARCVENFNRIYWWRGQRAGFRRSQYKENVALATSVWRQLVKLRMPRPILHVVRLCGLDSGGPLLRAKKILNFSEREGRELSGWYEYEEAAPQDYLWTLCGYLSLPFWLPACAAQLSSSNKVGQRLSGINPVHLAAGCLVSVGGKFNEYKNLLGVETVCTTLGCSVKPVKRVVDQIPDYEIEFEREMEEVGHNWLMQRGIKASKIKLSIKEERETTSRARSSLGIKVEFKKKKREAILKRKKQLMEERLKQKHDASQQRWQHLTALTSWLQTELGKGGHGNQAKTDGWRSTTGATRTAGLADASVHTLG